MQIVETMSILYSPIQINNIYIVHIARIIMGLVSVRHMLELTLLLMWVLYKLADQQYSWAGPWHFRSKTGKPKQFFIDSLHLYPDIF